MKILYVEDNALDIDLTRRALAEADLDVTLATAVSLQAARTRLEAESFDVLLLDLRLPDGSGIELLTEVRAQNLPLAVVTLTGSGDEETAVAALKAGANDYLAKRGDYLQRLPRVLETAVGYYQSETARKSHPLRVLYAEHNPADIDLTRRHLRRHAPHIQLETVYNIDEALAKLPQQPTAPCAYDVLLLDYRLPGLSALDGLKIVYQQRRLPLPVVLVTGQGSEEIAVRALRLGAADYLVKHPGYLFELPKALESAYRSATLRESERRYRLLADNTLDVIWRMDLSLTFTYVNKSIEEMFGFTAAEFIGTALADHATPETMAHMAGVIAHEMDHLDQHTGVIFESALQHKDGSTIPVEIHGKIICDTNMTPLHLQGTTRDISERKAAETALHESEARYRSLFENNHAVMLILNPENGRIMDANPAAAEFYGWSRQQLQQMNISQINKLTPEEIQARMDAARSRQQKYFIFKHWLASGEERDVEVFSGPIHARGQQMLYSIVHDITERRRAEEALQQKTEELDSYFENALDLLAIADVDGRFRRLSHSWADLLGYPLDELEGASYLNYVHPDDIPITKVIADKLANRQEIEQFVNRYRCHDNSYRWLEWRAFLGEEFIFSVARDITDRIESEEQLRLQSAALDAAANAIVITNRDGQIQWANPAFTTLTGYTLAEALHRNPSVLINAGLHDESFHHTLWDTILAGHVWQGEMINRRRDGSLYVEEQIITPVRDEAENITHFVAIKQDVSERKAAEREREQLLAQMKAQAERVQQILETVPEGVLLVDADQQVVLANPTAQKILISPGLVQMGESLTQSDTKKLSALLQPALIGQWQDFQIDSRTFTAIARPIGGKSGAQGWVIVINDVTEAREQRRYQQAQERLATVGQLAAGIAHDFNNIMGVITLYAQMLQKSLDLPSKEKKRIDTIYEQAHHAANLIAQILDFSRRSVMERQVMNLLPLLKEMQKLLQRTLPENIEVSLIYDRNDYPILIDPTRIQQVLMNLAINARDAMPQGGLLTINVDDLEVPFGAKPPLPDMSAGRWVQIMVLDTGAGIQSENLPHLFEPFYTTKTADQGTGLGLAQVYGIVKQHEGFIDVQSIPGEGSTFIVYLPRQYEAVTAQKASGEQPATAVAGHETILIVEDNASIRQSIAETLSQLGYTILEASNGYQALDTLAQNRDTIDLVITDLVMPEMGGIELIREMRQRHYAPKVLVMSGYADRQDDALKLDGVAGMLDKPFDINELTTAIRQTLDAVP